MPLLRRTSARAQETIQRAFKELESAVSVADAQQFRTTTIQDVQKACQMLENELGARKLLRNMGRLEPLLKGLECYGKVVDTLCQGTPFLPWIWAPIVAILKIGADCILAFETLIKAYAKVGQSLARFENLRQTFENDFVFQEIVAVFYRDVLKFHECAYKFVTVSGWKRFFRTTWGCFERQFKAILDNLDRHGELIDKEANARNITDIQLLLKQLEAEQSERMSKVLSEQKTLITRYYQDIIARLQINETDQNSIWETLTGEVPLGSESTCAWILSQECIHSWLKKAGNIHSLWIQGKAGTGKSVIAAYLARFRSVDDDFVIRHFCSDLYESSTRYDHILKSIIRQLAAKNDDAIAYIHDCLLINRKEPTTSTLESMVAELVAIVSGSRENRKDVWIIIDGIDTCEQGGLTRCIALMDMISAGGKNSGDTPCKVLLTSRSEPPKKVIRKRSVVSLGKEAANVNEAIRLYTIRRLHSSPTADRLGQQGFSLRAVTELANEVTLKADGMFLYARLIIDYLSKQLFRTSADLRDGLRELPPEFKGFYHKIVSNILSQLSPASVEAVTCVLHWVAFSTIPLREMELLSAVTFTTGDERVDKPVPSFFLQDCLGLLEERPDKTIGYVHATLKDFLLGPGSPLPINADSAQRQLAVGTVTCLSVAAAVFSLQSDDEKARKLTVQGLFAFLNYASKHWTDHVVAYAEQCDKNGSHDSLFGRATIDLSKRLQKWLIERGVNYERAQAASQATDTNLLVLQSLCDILPFITAARASQERLLGLESTDSSCNITKYDAVSDIFEEYQKTVLSILNQGYSLEVSKEEFERFGAQARASVFACRLSACPRSSRSFHSEAELLAHEREHTMRYPCQVDGCQFPAFASFYLLDKHRKKHHEQGLKRRALKHVSMVLSESSIGASRQRPVALDPTLYSGGGSLDGRPDMALTMIPKAEADSLEDSGDLPNLANEYHFPHEFLAHSTKPDLDLGEEAEDFFPDWLEGGNFPDRTSDQHDFDFL